MNILRRITATISAILAVVVVIMALLWAVTSKVTVDDTITESREIEAAFMSAAQFVDGFFERSGRLPYQNELVAGTRQHFMLGPMVIAEGELPTEVVERFGEAPPGSYLLVYWRGEWSEYYASWVRKSSLQFDASAYYMFGGPLLDALAGLAISAALLLFTFMLWPNQALQRDGQPAARVGHT